MKLNPPETAPKDNYMFLGFFKTKYGYPTRWHAATNEWITAIEDEKAFANASYPAKALTGWLSLPKIDDEWNVQ